MDEGAVLARVAAVIPSLSHDLQAVRRRALQNVASKIDVGLVPVDAVPAHDLVAHGLAFCEREAAAPTQHFLGICAELLLAVVRGHGAGPRALNACARRRGIK